MVKTVDLYKRGFIYLKKILDLLEGMSSEVFLADRSEELRLRLELLVHVLDEKLSVLRLSSRLLEKQKNNKVNVNGKKMS